MSVVKYAINNLTQRKLRSFLTILSILIGITSITALISFGNGVESYVDTIASEAGADKLYLQPRGAAQISSDPNFYFTKDDINFF